MLDPNQIKTETLASIVQHADNSILLLNAAGDIIWANRGFEKMYGYNPLHKKPAPGNDNFGFIRKLNETDRYFFNSHSSLSFSRPFNTSEGSRIWIQSTLTPVKSPKGEIEHFIVIETDITHQKEVEEDLIQRQENALTLSEHLETVKVEVEEQIKELNEEKDALDEVRKKTELVLQKVLPYEVAIQLRKKGYAAPRHYKKVTIFHLNFRNYNQLLANYPIEEVIEKLHAIHIKFDEILEQHFIEKIKTNGGVYLGAGGVPLRNRSNPIDAALASLILLETFNSADFKNGTPELPNFEICIGLHTGNVIAGVVGNTKLAYDIWGDSINIAAILEANANPKSVMVSEETYTDLEPYFICTPAGTVNDIHHNKVNTFILNRIKPEFSANESGTLPNESFQHLLTKI